MRPMIPLALATTVLLAACGDPHLTPGVSAYNDNGVSLVQPHAVSFTEQQLVSRATSFCQLGSKKTAVKISSRKLPRPHGIEHNYQCLSGL